FFEEHINNEATFHRPGPFDTGFDTASRFWVVRGTAKESDKASPHRKIAKRDERKLNKTTF
ncbi:MAG TPA: hypothetical protein VGV18_02740, partial [Verrucomicrobiae bacterium]|nr:hypothetical protein [Verrucomicrobiae bacterium]